MYVGPWQEYRLGQLFNEQTRLLADAVRQQIHQQIIHEQALQPQIQLPSQHRAGPSLSYSESLRKAQFTNASIASTASTRSGLSRMPSTSSSGQVSLRSPHSHSNSVSQLHTPKSASSAASSHGAMLPPLQAAARAAVQSMHQSRLRATAAHPLGHLVASYYPEALSSQSSTPMASDRPSSRASSFSAAAWSPGGGGGGRNGALPPGLKPRKMNGGKKKATEKSAAQQHREHITRLRSLYGLQPGQVAPGPDGSPAASPSDQAASVTSPPSGSSSASTSQAGSPLPGAAAVTLPRIGAQQQQHLASGAPSIQPTNSTGTTNSASTVHRRGPALPPAPLPVLTKQTLALYGPLPQDVQDSLHFYANPGSHVGAAPAPLHVFDDAPSPPPPPIDSLGWLKDTRPIPGGHSSRESSAGRDRTHSRPTSSSARSMRPHHAPPSSLSFSAGPSSANNKTAGPLLAPLGGPSNHTLIASASHAGLMAGAAAAKGQHHLPTAIPNGTKLSAEARLMAGMDHRLQTPTDRLRTPQRDLHSSGGFSESGDFENEVNDLLGWAENISNAGDEISPTHQRMQPQTLQVHH